MSRGLYSLTSGMLTQQRKIDVTGNNLANTNTAGYKKEQAITSNFGNLMITKYNQSGLNEEYEPLGSISLIRTVLENNTVHTQGALEETGSITDFAIDGAGFFAINNNGQTLYTRNGSFNIDTEGYLVQNNNRVQGEFGDVYIGTDNFSVIPDGSIVVDGEVVDKIALYDFEDYANLNKYGEGTYISIVEPEIVEYPTIINKHVESSNVDITEEISSLMSSQRAIQTASQALKIYDMINEKAVNEIGKI